MSLCTTRRATGVAAGIARGIGRCDPLTWVWVFLVAASALAVWLGHSAQRGHDGAALYLHICRAGVLLTAFFKVWLIGHQFMELQHAPAWLRRSYEAWILVACGVLVWISWR